MAMSRSGSGRQGGGGSRPLLNGMPRQREAAELQLHRLRVSKHQLRRITDVSPKQQSFQQPLSGDNQGYAGALSNGNPYHESPLAYPAPPAPTPNRGPEITEQESQVEGHIDWLSVTFPVSDLDFVLDLVSTALDCAPEDWAPTDGGWQGYTQGLVGPGKAKIWSGAKGRDDSHVVLPGKACAAMGSQRTWSFMEAALSEGAKGRRVDLAVDDFLKRVGVMEVWQHMDSELVVTQAKEWLLIVSGGMKGNVLKDVAKMEFMRGFQEAVRGATVYAGRMKSRRKLRVYDKGKESDGKVDAIRWELQETEEAAEEAMRQLVTAGSEWGRALSSRMVGYLDFRELGGTNVSRRSRVDWYESLMGDVERAKGYAPIPAQTFDGMFEYAWNHWGQSFAVIKARGGMDLVEAVIDNGKRRWKHKHEVMAGVKR